MNSLNKLGSYLFGAVTPNKGINLTAYRMLFLRCMYIIASEKHSVIYRLSQR